jgi:hypothetical protein
MTVNPNPVSPHPLDESSTLPIDPTVDRLGEADLRVRAVARLRKKAEFRTHLMIYALVNGALVVIWAMTGANFFWPVFPMAGWGVGIVAHAMEVYRDEEPTEEQIAAEMRRLANR